MRTNFIKKKRVVAGSTAVEGALVLTVFLTTFIGIIDIGTLLFRLQGLTERARSGARWGIVNVYSETNIRNVVLYGNSAGGTTPMFSLTSAMVSVSQVDIGDGITKIQVRITGYPVRFYTPFISGNRTMPPVEVSLTSESLGVT